MMDGRMSSDGYKVNKLFQRETTSAQGVREDLTFLELHVVGLFPPVENTVAPVKWAISRACKVKRRPNDQTVRYVDLRRHSCKCAW
jgi:hypothetical protein